MPDIDVTGSWADLEAHRDRCPRARHRQLLQTVIDHVRAEIELDVDAVMATLVPEPRFHVWAGGRDIGPKGAVEVRRYYEDFVAGAGAYFESRKDRIVVDDHTIAHEGPVANLVPAWVARRRRYPVPDGDGHYLVRFRNVVFWSFDEEGLALGEDSYAVLDLDAWEPVPDQELPEGYLTYLRTIDALDGDPSTPA